MPQIEAETTERDLVEEVEELLNDVGFRGDFENVSRPLLRRLVEEVKARDKLIVHMHVHSSYRNNGYMQMTTPQKALYDAIWNRSVKELDDEERSNA